MDFHAHYGRLCRLRLPHSTHKICISGKKSHSIGMPMIHYTIFSDIMQVFFRNFHNIFMQSAPTPELRQRLPYLSAPVEKSCSDDFFFAFLFHRNRRWVFHRFQQPDFLQKRNPAENIAVSTGFLLFRQFYFSTTGFFAVENSFILRRRSDGCSR